MCASSCLNLITAHHSISYCPINCSLRVSGLQHYVPSIVLENWRPQCITWTPMGRSSCTIIQWPFDWGSILPKSEVLGQNRASLANAHSIWVCMCPIAYHFSTSLLQHPPDKLQCHEQVASLAKVMLQPTVDSVRQWVLLAAHRATISALARYRA